MAEYGGAGWGNAGTWRGMAEYGGAWRNMVGLGGIRRGMAGLGGAGQSMAGYDCAWRIMADGGVEIGDGRGETARGNTLPTMNIYI